MKRKSIFSQVFHPRSAGPPLSSRMETEVSSFPFVSGDTFMQMAATVIEEEDLRYRPELNPGLIFVSAPVALKGDFVDRAERLLEEHDSPPARLLIHNGDQIPSSSVLERLGEIFISVHCVNVVSETSRVRALPIGLENACLNNNGRLAYYLEGLEEPRGCHRARLAVSSFHPSNNPSLREPVAELFRKSRFGFDGHSWKRREYREVLKQTCFVISPPGNGPDCHRTWEALYMGAVPVVLKSYLAESLVEGMPILAVESYVEFLEKNDDELRDIYRDLTARHANKAFATHWIKELF